MAKFPEIYKSKKWEIARNTVILRDKGLCVECSKKGIIRAFKEVHHIEWLNDKNKDDWNITYNPKNLMCLCRDCHFEVHGNSGNLDKFATPIYDYCKTYIVWGSPASGKTTYVKDNMCSKDIVVDLDYIMSALSISEIKNSNKNTLPFALDVVQLLYKMIGNKVYPFQCAWIITTMPNKSKRETLAKELSAELIHINTDKQTCLDRAYNDIMRNDKIIQKKIINKYFNELEI